MKKLLIILALCSMCICSCTPDAPPAESSAESSTEATTTAATTEVTDDVEEIEKFKPTEDNVIWKESSGVLDDLFEFVPKKSFFPLGITVSPNLEEILESADEDDRIAVMFLSVYNGEEETPTEGVAALPFHEPWADRYDKNSEDYDEYNDKYINPFSAFPEGYAKQYIMNYASLTFAFMTPGEISEVVVNEYTGLVMDSVSYETFASIMHVDETESSDDAEEIEKFNPTEDNAVWGDADNDGQLLSGDGMTSLVQRSFVKFGEIYISDQLRSAMTATEGGGKPIAVQYRRDMAEAADGEWEIFSKLPDGFEENYVTQITDKGGVMFITAEEIGLLTADPDVKLALGTVSYEFYSDLMKSQVE